MKKKAFTTSDIAQICHHSRETVKRWLEGGRIKGYRIGTSGHWRVLPMDLARFLKDNNIPFPEPGELDNDLKALINNQDQETFCWEFNKNRADYHMQSGLTCENCLVYRVKAINCHALMEEVGHKKVYCKHSCEDCEYFHFRQKEKTPDI